MKKIKFIWLFLLTLFCQLVYAQTMNEELVKSFNLKVEQVPVTLSKSNAKEAIKTQLGVPNSYELHIQTIHGTQNITEFQDSLGCVHERYAQFYNGIKIENSDIRIHYKNDAFVSANGEYIDVPDIDISVSLSEEEAIQYAKDYVTDELANEGITNVFLTSLSSVPQTVICRNRLYLQDTLFHIAYKIDIYAQEPLRHDYLYVDAKNGTVLDIIPIFINVNGTAVTRYSGTRTISTQQNGTTYRLRDISRGNGIETYNLNHSTSTSNAVDFTDNDNNWTAAEFHNANKDDGALDAHWGAMMTYDYFKNIHGRNSYDNNNSAIKNYVHYGANYENAGWSQWYHYMIYGDGWINFDILTALDVIAHEIGHGVCEYTANLVYQGEAGAINEGLSDIWAACVENYSNANKQIWLIGEDIELRSGHIALRSMSNPNTEEQPDTYGGTNWVNPASTSDYGGVHTNSGVMNYWFYLLSVGGSGTNDIGNAYNVIGISLNKAAKIVYRAESVYMTSNTNFNNARTYTIASATDLYGAGYNEVIAVTNAWHAVGVGAKYPLSGPSTICTTPATYTLSSGSASSWGVTPTSAFSLTSTYTASAVVKPLQLSG